MDQARPLLELSGATLRFGPDAALDQVDFRMFAGEVHSLMGENGAGKSTLIKAITGALALDGGTLEVEGEPRRFRSPHEAQAAGIGVVYQEIDLLPNLSVAENIVLGRESRRGGLIDHSAMRARARELLDELSLDLDPRAMLGRQSVAVQQLVAIARAIATDVKVLVLDEPTSSLDSDEVGELFRVVRKLQSRGVGILFVSHFIEQVYEISDRITVLRDGKLVGEYLTHELLRIELAQKMLGRELSEYRERDREQRVTEQRAPILVARGATVAPGIRGADVELAAGEVLGVAGLLGSGRTELARALTGVDRLQSGEITVDGGQQRVNSLRDALNARIMYSSENRRTEGIVADLTIEENISLALQAQRGVFRRIGPGQQRELASSWVEAFDIRPPDLNRRAGTLSGGNQQKLMLARLLATSPAVLVLDEPTRGIDVGAKVEIQNIVADLAENGIAVVFISAELEEVARVGDRLAVVRDGRIVATLDASEVTVDSVLALIARPDEGEDQ